MHVVLDTRGLKVCRLGWKGLFAGDRKFTDAHERLGAWCRHHEALMPLNFEAAMKGEKKRRPLMGFRRTSLKKKLHKIPKKSSM